MAAPAVKKIPPLRCPKCGSDRATLGFAQKKLVKKIGAVWLPDGWIYCDECEHRTHQKTGESEVFAKKPYGK